MNYLNRSYFLGRERERGKNTKRPSGIVSGYKCLYKVSVCFDVLNRHEKICTFSNMISVSLVYRKSIDRFRNVDFDHLAVDDCRTLIKTYLHSIRSELIIFRSSTEHLIFLTLLSTIVILHYSWNVHSQPYKIKLKSKKYEIFYKFCYVPKFGKLAYPWFAIW